MNEYNEITIELTNFCPFDCDYCSSDSINVIHDKNVWFQSIKDVKNILEDKHFKYIILSGGEPLCHPNFYWIWKECKEHCDDLIIYTNLLTHIIFNPNIIDGITKECNLNVNSDIDKIHILKRVSQGRQKRRPETHFSKNWGNKCDEDECNKFVVRKNGKMFKAPCDKYSKVKSLTNNQK